MEYSVGSLADFISGSKTPNKTKIVKKTFTPAKKEPQDLDLTSVGKEPQAVTSPKKKSKKFKVEQSEETVIDNPTHLKNRKKSKSKSSKSQIETDEENGESDKPLKPKNKKRKVDPSNADLADSDQEETTPKKPKLSRNETNAASRIKNKINQENKNSGEYKDRTLFVGNIPITITKKKLNIHFKKYGPIDSIRIRGIPVADPKTTKKVAAIKKEYHPDRNTVYAFIRFKSSEDAKKAEAENGELFHEHHLRVHFCESDDKPDEAKAIFVGNLAFNAEEEELWNLFKPCGPISHVRIVRDGRTSMGKGFGYVNFKDTDSVHLALEMEKFVLRDRELRISLCDSSRSSKKKMGKKPRIRNRPNQNGDGGAPFKGKRFYKGKNDGNGSFSGNKFNDMEKGKKFERNARPNQQDNGDGGSPYKKFSNDKNGGFSGTKFNDMKKKKKFNKAGMEKKKLANKLVASKPQTS